MGTDRNDDHFLCKKKRKKKIGKNYKAKNLQYMKKKLFAKK